MSRKNNSGMLLAVSAIILAITPAAVLANPTGTEREAITKIVLQIQKADYEDDRPGLQHLYGELAPFTESKDLASRVRYWRGFALWRKAINGFNDNVDKKDLEQDLHEAAEEFEKSALPDPGFVDAKIALGSCFGLLAYSVNKKDPAEMQALAAKSRQALRDAQAMAPDNPRLLWVLGPIYWNIPVERGGGQAKAMDAYEKGLETLRTQRNATNDPLEPAWGEPELLMNLAWSNLSRTTPDLNAAEKYAQSALALVPYWHYVCEILMQQIRDAKAKQSGTS
jgi:hypothetical protein